MSTKHPTALLTDSPTPLYEQIKEIIRAGITDGTYLPSSRLPSESELMAMFGVSRVTVRQAITDLQDAGVLFKIHGKGAFVAPGKAYQQVNSLKGLAEAMSSSGYHVKNRVISVKQTCASAIVANRLSLEPATPIVELQRIRMINAEIVSLEVTYLPMAIGKNVIEDDLVNRDVFLILEESLDIKLGHADISIDAISASPNIAELMNITLASPLMRIERLTHDVNGTPIDFEYLYYRGDSFQYRLRVDRER